MIARISFRTVLKLPSNLCIFLNYFVGNLTSKINAQNVHEYVSLLRKNQ